MKRLFGPRKWMAGLCAAAILLSAILPTVRPGLVQAYKPSVSRTKAGTLIIPSIGMTRTVFETTEEDIQNIQASIDTCDGATSFVLMYGVTWIAAHRTECGSNGFGGIEKLPVGAIATYVQTSKSTDYRLTGYEIRTSNKPKAPPFGTDLVLQTSHSPGRAYVMYFTETTRSGSHAEGLGRKLNNGETVCFNTGTEEGGFAFVNLTATDSEGGGYATMYPHGSHETTTSAVNWSGEWAEPNMTLVPVGVGGKACATAHGARTNLVVDIQATASPHSFTWISQRLIDTRHDNKPVTNGTLCFMAPAAANQWVVLNITPIGITPGFGSVGKPGTTTRTSIVNYWINQANPNMAIMELDSAGQGCYTGHGSAHIVIDMLAIAEPGVFASYTPRRVWDSRVNGVSGIRSQMCMGSSMAAPGYWMFANATPVGVPKGVGVGQVHRQGAPTEADRSDVNYAQRPDPNMVVFQNGPGQLFCVSTMGEETDWVFDMMALGNPEKFTQTSPARAFDSRISTP